MNIYGQVHSVQFGTFDAVEFVKVNGPFKDIFTKKRGSVLNLVKTETEIADKPDEKLSLADRIKQKTGFKSILYKKEKTEVVHSTPLFENLLRHRLSQILDSKIRRVSRRLVPKGYHNPSAFCYAHAILQCLMSSNYFCDFIMNLLTPITEDDRVFVNDLSNDAFNRFLRKEYPVLFHFFLLKSLETNFPHMLSGDALKFFHSYMMSGPQDASELLTKILQDFANELHSIDELLSTQSEDLGLWQISKGNGRFYRTEKRNAVVEDIFTIVVDKHVHNRQTGAKSTIREHLKMLYCYDLRHTLEETLESVFASEEIGETIVSYTIVHVPEIVVIVFNRIKWENGLVKNRQVVEYSYREEIFENVRYLSGVVYHRGELEEMGHYFTNVLRSTPEECNVFNVNDSVVKPVSLFEGDDLGDIALLFYEKKIDMSS
ncbi:hypothetical protein PCE1_002030 [Barthelona sp. PCE]